MRITAASFPTPHFIQVSSNPAVRDQQAGFAQLHAGGTNQALDRLNGLLEAATSQAERVNAFEQTYRELAQWRYDLSERSSGQRPGATPESYRASIGRGFVTDPFGKGTHRDGDLRMNSQGTLFGGTETPASRLAARLSDIAAARFDAEAPDAEVLQNKVRLPDGTTVNGNQIQRGRAAAAARNLPENVKDFYCTQTGTEADRKALQQAAFTSLAELEAQRASGRTDLLEDPAARQAFVEAEYFIYQGPEFQRGGDASIRALLVAAHTRVFDAPVKLPQDIDVMAYVASQQDFYAHVERHQTVLTTDAPAVQPEIAQVAARAAVPATRRTTGQERG
ncbi:hypothetical protein [Kribbella catacumbae]|uniref:hypothetical protein n=1 Tax=Kribbella catacumbae TaxID=460086 RepID=UPI000380EF91|nr:hypothetical protein [Kribbella catacumbae]